MKKILIILCLTLVTLVAACGSVSVDIGGEQFSEYTNQIKYEWGDTIYYLYTTDEGCHVNEGALVITDYITKEFGPLGRDSGFTHHIDRLMLSAGTGWIATENAR